jgi:hypothetical protein
MISIHNLQLTPAGRTISSDDIVELHSARLLLLISICGTKDNKTKLPRIDGLTKLAKLDFFVRYPSFFERVAQELNHPVIPVDETIESKMVRYHYGPWDQRYYQLLPYLEARNLVEIKKEPKRSQYKFFLTEEGERISNALLLTVEFLALGEKIKKVREILGKKTGNELKNLVYKIFEEEVAAKKLGEVIS